ncbi:hypothetical protein GQ55_1G061700 [Panicum hallii var. hallii]|jgi:hypothetical protein|uniref:Uncharacterized protein n=2 Tax=Panicum hallii TaxID=206008 RepID=A0A2T7F2T5_9POAL|nr:uncharacterized protein LOC112891257 [Panicum hallii]PAN04385.1 hypothetical protein PAHAL_1G063500 [Panicum hallii]PUZ74391.1 hypothetical protein GQ55_1G061700 [Panicum hallii var. hallii]
MEALPSPASPPSSLSALRHRLRASVCCCFGSGGGLGERMRWRRRAGVGEFRYDPLSYALNFDEGDLDADDEDLFEAAHAGRGDGLLYQSFSSRLSTPAAAIEVA